MWLEYILNLLALRPVLQRRYILAASSNRFRICRDWPFRKNLKIKDIIHKSEVQLRSTMVHYLYRI